MTAKHESSTFRVNGRNIVIRSLDIDILKLISNGYTYPEIAEYLHYSERSIAKEIQILREKTRTHNAAGLIAFCIRNGIIE